MSEFSSSWLIRPAADEDVQGLLSRAGIGGWHAEVGNGWMVVVPRGGKSLAELFHSVVISYEFGEDHGMWLRVYEDTMLIMSYECEFEEMDEDDIESGLSYVDYPDRSSATISELLGCDERELISALEPQDFDEVLSINHTFMELLGIPPELYEWISPEYLEDMDGNDNAFQEIKID